MGKEIRMKFRSKAKNLTIFLQLKRNLEVIKPRNPSLQQVKTYYQKPYKQIMKVENFSSGPAWVDWQCVTDMNFLVG